MPKPCRWAVLRVQSFTILILSNFMGPAGGLSQGRGDYHYGRDRFEMEGLCWAGGLSFYAWKLIWLCLVADLVFFEFAVKRRQADVEQAGCLGLVATGMDQNALDMQFFHTGQVEGGKGSGGPES